MLKKENYNDPINYIIGISISIILIISSIFGLQANYYSYYDYIFTPFMIAGRKYSQDINKFFYEVSNKASILDENIELKKKIIDLERVYLENKRLKEQIEKLSQSTMIESVDASGYYMVEVSGVQNTFSSDPILRVYLAENMNIKKWDPVYFDKDVLFGFVYNLSGNSADIIPFYSPRVTFNIPVTISNDKNIKGFVDKINKGKLTIRNISAKSQIAKDDIWVTSNDVLDVPPGLIVGYTNNENDVKDGFKSVNLVLPYSTKDITYLLLKK